jgi:hypothetical protein
MNGVSLFLQRANGSFVADANLMLGVAADEVDQAQQHMFRVELHSSNNLL